MRAPICLSLHYKKKIPSLKWLFVIRGLKPFYDHGQCPYYEPRFRLGRRQSRDPFQLMKINGKKKKKRSLQSTRHCLQALERMSRHQCSLDTAGLHCQSWCEHARLEQFSDLTWIQRKDLEGLCHREPSQPPARGTMVRCTWPLQTLLSRLTFLLLPQIFSLPSGHFFLAFLFSHFTRKQILDSPIPLTILSFVLSHLFFLCPHRLSSN